MRNGEGREEKAERRGDIGESSMLLGLLPADEACTLEARRGLRTRREPAKDRTTSSQLWKSVRETERKGALRERRTYSISRLM